VTTTKPYLFLDFDGVLNYRRLPFREYLVEVESSEMPRHAFINTSSGEVATFTVRIPNAYPSWLAELSTRYELAWATTWETLANTYLAPLLGLDDDLPVVEFSKHPPSLDQIQRDEIAEWKWEQLVEFAGGHPFVFIDDAADRLANRFPMRDSSNRCAIFAPHGLLREHVDKLLAHADTM
jgi:hypothetical protein